MPAYQYQQRYRDYDPSWWPRAADTDPLAYSPLHWTAASWDGWEYGEQHNGRAWIAYRRRCAALEDTASMSTGGGG